MKRLLEKQKKKQKDHKETDVETSSDDVVQKQAEKTSEKLSLPAYPNAGQFQAWRSQVRDEVAAAFAKPNEAFEWVCEVEDDAVVNLQPRSRFAQLDARLSTALGKIIKGDPARRMRLLAEKLAN